MTTLKHSIRMWARRGGLDIRRFNHVESAEARIVRQLQVHEIDLVLDVGANDGGFGRSLRACGYEGRILSFEPLSAAHASLLTATASDASWQVAPRAALGETSGTITINIAGNSTSSSILPMNSLHEQAEPTSRYTAQESTSLQRLADVQHPWIVDARATLLKIDTQGYEMQVLRGADEMLQRIKGVQVELSCATLYEGQSSYIEVATFLEQRGFHLWNVVPGFVDPRSARMLQFDGIFFRD